MLILLTIWRHSYLTKLITCLASELVSSTITFQRVKMTEKCLPKYPLHIVVYSCLSSNKTRTMNLIMSYLSGNQMNFYSAAIIVEHMWNKKHKFATKSTFISPRWWQLTCIQCSLSFLLHQIVSKDIQWLSKLKSTRRQLIYKWPEQSKFDEIIIALVSVFTISS